MQKVLLTQFYYMFKYGFEVSPPNEIIPMTYDSC